MMELPASLLTATTGGGTTIPEWGWGLISIVLVVLIGLIAYLLRRRDEGLSRAIKDTDQRLAELSQRQIDLKEEQVRHGSTLVQLGQSIETVDKREPTIPTSYEELFRQLNETRIQHAGMIERQTRELSAVERKLIARITALEKDLRELQERMWQRQVDCQSQYVLKQDYQRHQAKVMTVLEELKTAAVKLETVMKDRKKRS
jgi:hypothetical protein